MHILEILILGHQLTATGLKLEKDTTYLSLSPILPLLVTQKRTIFLNQILYSVVSLECLLIKRDYNFNISILLLWQKGACQNLTVLSSMPATHNITILTPTRSERSEITGLGFAIFINGNLLPPLYFPVNSLQTDCARVHLPQAIL